MRETKTCGALWAIALVLLMSCVATVQGTPLKHNYVVLPELTAAAGDGVMMSVRLYNEAELEGLIVPLQIRDVDFVDIDSITFTGGRLDGMGMISTIINGGNHALLISFLAATPTPGFIPAGDGEIAKVYLKVAPSAGPGDVVVDTTVFFGGDGIYSLFDTSGVNVQDYFVSGLIHVTSGQPIIHLNPTTFAFSTVIGVNPVPQSLDITNLGVDPLNWQITYKPTWLNLSAMSGTAPSTITLSPDVVAYPSGLLVDSIAVNDPNAVVPTEWARITVTIRSPDDVTRCLALHEGWNLISWNVDTPDDDVETIIANIKGCVDVILGFEQGAASYDPFLPQFSTLTALDHLHGYWFHMTCDTVLCVTGSIVSDHTPIALEPNWNLVSYLPNHIDSTKRALGGILNGLIVALGFNNGGLVYDPALPQFATLKTMGPGFGYWLKTDGPYDLIYGLKPASPLFQAAVGSMKPFPPAPGVTPTTEWISLYGDGITLDGELIPTGTVLATYDENGHLCGQAIVEAGGTIRFTPVYRDDNSTSLVEGPELGGSINLTVNGVPVQQSYIFGGLGERIRLTTLNSLSRPSENLPRQFGLAQNYPNPFNPSTAIEFSLPTASRTTLEVFNVVGERVTTLIDRFLTAGKYSVMWDGSNAAGKPVSSGMYFYRLKAGDFVDTKKMMLVK